jgi:hypothetical protein
VVVVAVVVACTAVLVTGGLASHRASSPAPACQGTDVFENGTCVPDESQLNP